MRIASRLLVAPSQRPWPTGLKGLRALPRMEALSFPTRLQLSETMLAMRNCWASHASPGLVAPSLTQEAWLPQILPPPHFSRHESYPRARRLRLSAQDQEDRHARGKRSPLPSPELEASSSHRH